MINFGFREQSNTEIENSAEEKGKRGKNRGRIFFSEELKQFSHNNNNDKINTKRELNKKNHDRE